MMRPHSLLSSSKTNQRLVRHHARARGRSGGVITRASVDPQPGGDGAVIQLGSPEEYNDAVNKASTENKILCVMISTKTCGPCEFVYPKFVDFADDGALNERVLFAKIYGDASTETRGLMKEWGVKAVPLFRFVDDSGVVDTYTGSNADGLKKKIGEVASEFAKA